MITSEIGLGRIYAGDTDLACSITFAQTGSNTIAMSEGVLTISGNSHTVESEEFALADGVWQLQLGIQSGDSIVLAVHPGPDSPAGFELIQTIAGFGSGILVEAGAIVGDVYVFEVLPGYAE